MNIYLETGRLLLRRLTLDDADHILDLDSDPEVVRFTGGGVTSREEVTESLFPPVFAWYEKYDSFGYWAAIEKSSNRFIGWFHFRPDQQAADIEDIELGYRLRQDAWGNGYATEGSRALVEKGFGELGVKRVYAHALIENFASIHVMEKSGLRYVKHFTETRIDPPGEAVQYALEIRDYVPPVDAG